MKDLFKTVTWLSLVGGWIFAIVWALIFRTTSLAVGLGVLAICTWVAWGVLLAWLFGLRRRVRKFLGYSLKKATFLEKEIAASRVADVRRALESLYAGKGAERTVRLGIDSTYNQALFSNLPESDTEVKPLKWSSIEVQTGRFENLPTNAVYLLHHEGEPFAVYLSSPSATKPNEYVEDHEPTTKSHVEKLQVFAASLDAAARAVEYVMRVASVGSVYRGKMLHVSPRGPGLAGHVVRVFDRPQIDERRIVLPQAVLEVMQRAISARLEYHRLLERHGHSSKTGLLLHGVPGTGKTLVAKHLIGACRNHTAIVPTGMESETLREAFRLAVYLQPALIVIEDVDLLAERRETNANVTGLQELMNEMDGLAPSTEAIVLMTTNRPEILEPALASRPGRVSQAIHFPLPDAALRGELLKMFCSAANSAGVNFEHWIQRTKGASPAFLEELTKKAILFAALRSGGPQNDATLQLTNQDFDQAMHELVVFGGALTSNLLGFPTASNTTNAAATTETASASVTRPASE